MSDSHATLCAEITRLQAEPRTLKDRLDALEKLIIALRAADQRQHLDNALALLGTGNVEAVKAEVEAL